MILDPLEVKISFFVVMGLIILLWLHFDSPDLDPIGAIRVALLLCCIGATSYVAYLHYGPYWCWGPLESLESCVAGRT